MRKALRRAIALGVASAALALGAGPVAAGHAHFVYQPAHGNHPATCRYIAEGQTKKAFDAPGGHAFHDHVHTGQPGSDSKGTDFDKADNAGNYDCVWVNQP